MVKIYSWEDINDCVSDSVSNELMSLSVMLFNLSLAVAAVIFNFSFGTVCGVLTSGFLRFGVDVLPGVITLTRRAFIAPETIIVLIKLISSVSISNVLSLKESTIVRSWLTSATILYTSILFGVSHFFLFVAKRNLVPYNKHL